jgi:hypothetical protein
MRHHAASADTHQRKGFARFLAETAPTHVVANKLGRIVWAVWTKDVPYAAAAAA